MGLHQPADHHSTDSIIISQLLGSLSFTGTCWENHGPRYCHRTQSSESSHTWKVEEKWDLGKNNEELGGLWKLHTGRGISLWLERKAWSGPVWVHCHEVVMGVFIGHLLPTATITDVKKKYTCLHPEETWMSAGERTPTIPELQWMQWREPLESWHQSYFQKAQHGKGWFLFGVIGQLWGTSSQAEPWRGLRFWSSSTRSPRQRLKSHCLCFACSLPSPNFKPGCSPTSSIWLYQPLFVILFATPMTLNSFLLTFCWFCLWHILFFKPHLECPLIC